MTGCASSREVAKTDIINEKGIVSLSQIQKHNLVNNDFDITRAEISYSDEGTSEELIAGISYRKDQKYLISLRTKAGFEIGRIMITKDTLLANDRLNRKLYYGSPVQFELKYGIETDWLPILFGDLIGSWEDNFNSLNCKNNEAKLERRINAGTLTYFIDCNEGKVRMIDIARPYGKRIAIRFNNFIETSGKKYPSEIEITENESNSEIKIRIRKAEINSERELKFVPGEGYERIMLK